MVELSHHEVEVQGVRLHVVTAGPEQAPPLLLLHGWPESWRTWTELIPLLGRHFFLIVPDQRGFGDSDRPEGTDAYRLSALVADLIGILDRWSVDQIGVVGHDTGGALAWTLGMTVPDRVRRMVILAAPHPMRLREASLGDPRQARRAFYVWLMHSGEPGERLLGSDEFRLLAAWAFAGSGVSEDLIEHYRREWARPGAFHAMAEWYRANYRPDFLNPDVALDLPPVRVPVRYLHAERDAAFVPEAATGSGKFVEAAYDERVVPGTTHWLPHEEPELVADLITDWMEQE
ncbi:MAG: alpha/beta fold hydrolase [Acidimicrobiia bacterium]